MMHQQHPAADSRACLACDRIFHRRRNGPTKYCSRRCRDIGQGRRMIKPKLQLPILSAEDEQLLADNPRPTDVRQCPSGPCPFVSCQYHLYLDVDERGRLILNHPGMEVDEIGDTCALDVARRHGDVGMLLDDVGRAMGISRARVQQMEQRGLQKLRRADERRGSGLRDLSAHQRRETAWEALQRARL